MIDESCTTAVRCVRYGNPHSYLIAQSTRLATVTLWTHEYTSWTGLEAQPQVFGPLSGLWSVWRTFLGHAHSKKDFILHSRPLHHPFTLAWLACMHKVFHFQRLQSSTEPLARIGVRVETGERWEWGGSNFQGARTSQHYSEISQSRY